MLSFRREEKLLYQDFELPDEITCYSGYHKDCYKKFTSLSKAQRLRKENRDMMTTNLSKTTALPTEVQAQSETDDNSIQSQDPSRITRSAITSPKPNSNTGVFPKSCLFCGLKIKTVNGKRQTLICALSANFEQNIRKYAAWRHDDILLTKITGITFANKDVKYHNCCRLLYERIAKKTPLGVKDRKEQGNMKLQTASLVEWHNARDVHAKAFKAIICYVEDNITSKKKVQLMKDVNCHYANLLHEIGGEKIFFHRHINFKTNCNFISEKG